MAAASGIYDRFETCHGNFSMYSCLPDDWTTLAETSDIAAMVTEQLLTADTAEAAYARVRWDLSATIAIDAIGCIWCVQGLIDSLWPNIDLVRSDCVPDPAATDCQDILATPLDAFRDCSGYDLENLMVPATTTTTRSATLVGWTASVWTVVALATIASVF